MAATGSWGWDLTTLNTSPSPSCLKPLACFKATGPVRMKTNGPAQPTLIFVSWPLFTPVSHEPFSFSFTWLPVTSSAFLPDRDNTLFWCSIFFKAGNYKSFRVTAVSPHKKCSRWCWMSFFLNLKCNIFMQVWDKYALVFVCHCESNMLLCIEFMKCIKCIECNCNLKILLFQPTLLL